MTSSPPDQPEPTPPCADDAEDTSTDMSGLDPTLQQMQVSPMLYNALNGAEVMRAWLAAGFRRREAFRLLRDALHDARMISAYGDEGDDDD